MATIIPYTWLMRTKQHNIYGELVASTVSPARLNALSMQKVLWSDFYRAKHHADKVLIYQQILELEALLFWIDGVTESTH